MPAIAKFVLTPEDMERIGELYMALGLDETATLDDVLGAIEALKAGEAPPEAPPAPNPEMPTAPMAAPTPEMLALQKEVGESREYIKGLEHDKIVLKYATEIKDFVTVADKDALTKQLVETHESVSPEAAASLVLAYKTSSDAVEEGGLLTPIGTSRGRETGPESDDDNDAFHLEVEEYAKEHSITFEVALNAMYKAKPTEFKAYMGRVNDTVYTNGHR